MVYNKDSVDYEIIVNLINKIFANVDENVRDNIFKIHGIVTRKTKLLFRDVILYSLEYTGNHKTKIDIVNKFNIDRDDDDKISRTTFFEKEIKIPFASYQNIYNGLNSIIKNYFNNNKDIIMSVDGTYNNTNVKNNKGYLETSLNMGFFDVTNDVPVELFFKGEESKNKELEALKKYIMDNKNNLTNVIFVLDRAYCSYKFINFCDVNKIKYVIRFRNNCKNIPKKKNRVIEFEHCVTETVKNNNIKEHLIDGKKFSSVTLETKNKYTLVTNLNLKEYTDDKIKEIYCSRWNVEVFFANCKVKF